MRCWSSSLRRTVLWEKGEEKLAGYLICSSHHLITLVFFKCRKFKISKRVTVYRWIETSLKSPQWKPRKKLPNLLSQKKYMSRVMKGQENGSRLDQSLLWHLISGSLSFFFYCFQTFLCILFLAVAEYRPRILAKRPELTWMQNYYYYLRDMQFSAALLDL